MAQIQAPSVRVSGRGLILKIGVIEFNKHEITISKPGLDPINSKSSLWCTKTWPSGHTKVKLKPTGGAATMSLKEKLLLSI